MSAVRTRMPARQRREVVIQVALRAFGTHGFAGTSTDAIAAEAGVSQPYLFRLFGTKKSMFLEVVRHGFGRWRAAFEGDAPAGVIRTPAELLEAVALQHPDLVVDSDLLRLQLQVLAACDDPEIRAVVHGEWAKLYEAAARWSGADDRTLRGWFAEGVLRSVAATAGDLGPGRSAASDSRLRP